MLQRTCPRCVATDDAVRRLLTACEDALPEIERRAYDDVRTPQDYADSVRLRRIAATIRLAIETARGR